MAIPLNEERFKTLFIDNVLANINFAIIRGDSIVAAQLLLMAADVISGITRPSTMEETNSNQFISWADKYLSLKGDDCQLTGLDIWSARCGFLHGFSPISSYVRKGRAKMLSYVDTSKKPVMMSKKVPNLAIVSIGALSTALANGITQTMNEIKSSSELSLLVNSRLEMMFYVVDLDIRYRNI